jgi:L-gulonolactone oxidase
MSANAAQLAKTARLRIDQASTAGIVTPESAEDLQAILQPGSGHSAPFRPRGAGSSATDCNTSTVGTIIDMTRLDEIVDIDAYNHRITVQAGARISQVMDALAAHGMELEGSHDLIERTVGGAVAGGCIGPSIGGESALFASQVLGVKVITPEGDVLTADIGQQKILNVIRLSYGMLGAIYEVTLKARATTGFSATRHRCNTAQFAKALENLARAEVGLRFFLLPFRDSVYLDVRRFDAHAGTTANPSRKIKDWGETTVLPTVFKSLNRIIPVSGMRYRLIDQVHSLTQGLVSNRLVSGGSMCTAQAGGRTNGLQYSTWCFPASDFGVVVQAYRDFCARVREESGFRCDMPTVGYLLGQDRSAILSPCFDEPVVALRTVSTQSSGWQDFAIDFGDFARQWGGTPLFNQSLETRPGYARTLFGRRLDYFRSVRRHMDPENRMMNPYLSQYFL